MPIYETHDPSREHTVGRMVKQHKLTNHGSVISACSYDSNRFNRV